MPERSSGTPPSDSRQIDSMATAPDRLAGGYSEAAYRRSGKDTVYRTGDPTRTSVPVSVLVPSRTGNPIKDSVGMSPVTVDRLGVAKSWLTHKGSVLFYGTPAATNNADIDALIRSIDDRRLLVCRSEHTDPERRLGALTALLSTVDEAEAAALPPGHRRLLAESIFRPPASAAPTPFAAVLGPAVLSLLQTLGRQSPLLLFLEAVHRLDHETVRVLEFVAGMAHESPVHMIAVEQVLGRSGPQGCAICPPPLVMIRLDSAPLSTSSN
jgi:hypothetical protein